MNLDNFSASGLVKDYVAFTNKHFVRLRNFGTGTLANLLKSAVAPEAVASRPAQEIG